MQKGVVPVHYFLSNYPFLFLLLCDPEAFKTCCDTIKLLNVLGFFTIYFIPSLNLLKTLRGLYIGLLLAANFLTTNAEVPGLLQGNLLFARQFRCFTRQISNDHLIIVDHEKA